MRILREAGLLILIAASAFAQHHGGGSSSPAPSAMSAPRGNLGSFSGFGNAVHPGTGHAPGPNSGGFHSGRFRRPIIYPVIVGGYFPYGGYGYPYSGYYGDGSYNGYPYQPDSGAYPSQQTPQVIINQNFAPDRAYPVVREYAPDTGVETIRTYDAPGRAPVDSVEEATPYYLLAFKDSSVYSAFAYWVEGDTLHYVTSDRIHNQASLSLVDRDLTERLNRDRNMQVKLPR